MLASRIGVFPAMHEPVNGIEYSESTLRPIAAANDPQPAFSRGDWREAASNIEDELDVFFKGRASSQ